MSPLASYNSAIAANEVLPDEYQRKVVERLDDLYTRCVEEHQQRANSISHKFFGKFKKEEVRMGFYLWGGVGVGKTHMMDMFYEALPFDEKMRMHFHEFMGFVHEMRRQLGNTEEPMAKIAKQFAKQSRVICLDEMHINDIADAMIMYRLIETLYKEGVTLVTTSNVPPVKLFRNGEYCEQFLPAIALMEENMEILNIKSERDYRRRELAQSNNFLYPNDAQSLTMLNDVYESVEGEDRSQRTLEIFGREVEAIKWKVGIVWFDFNVLCDIPRSQLDYIDIAEHFPTVILSDVHVIDDTKMGKLMRLINLVDVFYDSGTKLYISAETDVESLYVGEDLKFEFRRTKSRLTEMQSERYMGKPIELHVRDDHGE